MSLTAATPTHQPAGMPSAAAIAVGLVMLVAAVLLPAAPGLASHVCEERPVELPGGGYEITRVCPGHGSQGGGGGGSGGGGSGVTCERYIRLENIGHVYDDQGRTLRPVVYVCSDGSTWEQWECIPGLNPDPPGPACDSGAGPSPAELFAALLQRAAARVDIPLPGLRHTFDQPADDGTIRAVVRAETWWWTDAPLEPVVVDDQDGPIWVSVTATPGALEIDPGDGSGTLTCTSQLAYNHNVSYHDQVPGEPRGACVHVYEQVFDEVAATMSVTWTIAYEGFAPGLGAQSGSLGTQTRDQSTAFPVKEIQSVVAR